MVHDKSCPYTCTCTCTSASGLDVLASSLPSPPIGPPSCPMPGYRPLDRQADAAIDPAEPPSIHTRRKPVPHRADQYRLQPTEDLDEYDSGSMVLKPPPSRPSKEYRPVSLKWPFIAAQVTLILLLACLVSYVIVAMPDSDSDAVIQSRSLGALDAPAALDRREHVPIRVVPSRVTHTRGTHTRVPHTHAPSTSNSPLLSNSLKDDGRTSSSPLASSPLIPSNTIITATYIGLYTSTFSSTGIVRITAVSTAVLTAFATQSSVVTIDPNAIPLVLTSSVPTTARTTVVHERPRPPHTLPYGLPHTLPHGNQTHEHKHVPGHPDVDPNDHTKVPELPPNYVISTIVTQVPTATTVVLSSVITSSTSRVWIEIGPTTLVTTITVPLNNNYPQQQLSQQLQQVAPSVVAVTSTMAGNVQTKVFTFAAQTEVAVLAAPTIFTKIVSEGPIVVISSVPPHLTTAVVVVAPVAEALVFAAAVPTTVGGSTETLIGTASEPTSPQTFVTTVNGVSVTSVVTPSPVLFTSLVVVGGTATTLMVPQTTEPDDVTRYLAVPTVIDGSSTTVLVPTVEHRFEPVTLTAVSLVDGHLTTFVITTTPTASAPVTFSLLSLQQPSLITIVSTPPPSTIISTVSGRLTTILQTQNPITIISTGQPSTTVFSSTITPTSTPISAATAAAAAAAAAAADNANTSQEELVVEKTTFDISSAQYFIGKFLPVILSVLVSLPLRTMDRSAKRFQPFHALAHPNGAFGSESLTLSYDGPIGYFRPLASMLQGYPIPFVTSLIVAISSVMTALASGALGIKLHGHCQIDNASGCAMSLGVTPLAAYALLGFLVVAILLLALLLFLLRHWNTGVFANPFSIAGAAAMCRNPEVLSAQTGNDKALCRAVARRRYGFGWFVNEGGREEYGVLVQDELDSTRVGMPDPDSDRDSFSESVSKSLRGHGTSYPVPFLALTWFWRIGFACFLIGVVTVILYYHITWNAPLTFQIFMASQSIGVRFLFASLGLVITFAWESFLFSVAIITPYRHMASSPQPADRSVLVSRPSNPVSALVAAARLRSPLLAIAATLGVFAEFLPMLLANVPYTLTTVWLAHAICARLSIVILGLMALVLLGSLPIKWPPMPVDPRLVAGAMWYVADSALTRELEGAAIMDPRALAARIRGLRRCYHFSEGPGGRVGVHADQAGVDGEAGSDRPTRQALPPL